MEKASRAIWAAVNQASNNNTVTAVLLAGSFAGLAFRSAKQQGEIEALEAQKDSLAKSNKAIKKTLFDWKQQLFSESSSASDTVIPLHRLKSIYGEEVQPTTTATGNSKKNDGTSTQGGSFFCFSRHVNGSPDKFIMVILMLSCTRNTNQESPDFWTPFG